MRNAFKEIFLELIPQDDRPIVVYSALWPFTIALKKNTDEIADSMLEALLDCVGTRQTLFMPTFTKGFVNGICNLDREVSETGILTEKFRTLSATHRTISAFFSFAVMGPDSRTVVNLRPKEAWGAGSLYEWFHERDAHIITIGTHPTHCSFTHRAEWLARDVIQYRYEKSFYGKIISEGNLFDLKETLYVRRLESNVINDWTWAVDLFRENGMKIYNFKGITLSEFSAKKKMDIMVPIIYKDSLAVIKNKGILR